MSTEVPAAAPLGRLASELDPAVGWRILLVEDDDGDALLVRELLADGLPGARVERVTNLADARRAVRYVDCVLLDMGLPDAEGMTGVEALVAEARTPRSWCSPGRPANGRACGPSRPARRTTW